MMPQASSQDQATSKRSGMAEADYQSGSPFQPNTRLTILQFKALQIVFIQMISDSQSIKELSPEGPLELTFKSSKDFVEITRNLLRAEEKLEIQLFNEMITNKTMAQIQAEGHGLTNMVVLSTKKGFYGKTIITLAKAYSSEKNPQKIGDECKMQVGDDVALYRNNTLLADGVIYKRAGGKIKISSRNEIDDDNDIEGLNCNIILKWNEVTFKRYFATLNDLEQSDSPLLVHFFPHFVSTHFHQSYSKNIQYSNKDLNEQQNEAVRNGLASTVHLLHGPPGTGKTTTVCELIIEAVRRGQKVLACAPSNIAVDNIVESLFKRVNCVRIGNPARVIQNVVERCLDFLISKNTNMWKNEVKKLTAAKKKLSKATSRDQKKSLYNEIKHLRIQISSMQEQIIQEILTDTDVICCTNVGAADRIFRRYLPKRVFDLVVIDECGQSLEVSCWIPILRGKRVVLAGDHKQLPPTIKGNDKSLLSYTLFIRAMHQLTNISSTMLRVQYRMNNTIMGWSNKMFYDQKLKAHESVENHQLKQLYANVDENEEILLLIDTSGCGMGESGQKNQSKFNVGEADISLVLLNKLLGYGVQAKDIAILTPYSKQVAYIKSLIQNANVNCPDVSTVDGIQGRQKQCIIISLVRSNKRREIGFLKDWRRMNVAVTRARRMLILIGNSDCVKSDPHMKSLMEWVEAQGNVISAQEFRHYPTVNFGKGVSDQIQSYQKKENQVNQDQKAQKKKKKQQIEKDPKQHTDDEQNQLKQHYRKVFHLIDKQITINNATAFERKMIHEVAEELGLAHQTNQDKKFIKVWKKLTKEELQAKIALLNHQRELEEQEEQEKKEKKKKKKNNQENREAKHKKQETGNHKFENDMKQLIGNQSSEEETNQKQNKEVEKETKQKQEEKAIEPRKKKKNKAKQEEKEYQEEDLDAIFKDLEAEKPKKDQCFKCKKKISSVTTVDCRFCHISFCRNHVLAQEHGCDDDAKEEARGHRDLDKYIKSGAEKIKQKIKEQEDLRKRKPKKESKR